MDLGWIIAAALAVQGLVAMALLVAPQPEPRRVAVEAQRRRRPAASR